MNRLLNGALAAVAAGHGRSAWNELTASWRTLVAAIRQRGAKHECPCCRCTFSHFENAGLVTRACARCPICGALERHRVLALLLETPTPAAANLGSPFATRPRIRSARVLHVAPEPALMHVLQRGQAEIYLGVDKRQNRGALRADLTRLPLPDGSFDLIICNHVLEHVLDDRAAVDELARVCAPGGFLLISVPLNPASSTTHEDLADLDADDRLRRFGDPDHWRTYGEDIADRFASAGLSWRRITAVDLAGASRLERMGIPLDETLYLAQAPRRGSGDHGP